jgi:hypothetical protein
VLGKCYRRDRSVAFFDFLKKRTRYHLHFAPTHASWLSQVQRWFALPTQRQIKRGSHRSVQELDAVIRRFIAATISNQNPSAGQNL